MNPRTTPGVSSTETITENDDRQWNWLVTRAYTSAWCYQRRLASIDGLVTGLAWYRVHIVTGTVMIE